MVVAVFVYWTVMTSLGLIVPLTQTTIPLLPNLVLIPLLKLSQIEYTSLSVNIKGLDRGVKFSWRTEIIGVTNKICSPMNTLLHVLMTDDLNRWSPETC